MGGKRNISIYSVLSRSPSIAPGCTLRVAKPLISLLMPFYTDNIL